MEKLDSLIGEFLVEGAQFLELPSFGLQRLPTWLRKWQGPKKSNRKVCRCWVLPSGESLRELFLKCFCAFCIDSQRKSISKMTKLEKQEAKKQAKVDLSKDKEKRITKKCVELAFHMCAAKIKQMGAKLNEPILRKLFNGYVAIFSFVLTRMIIPFYSVDSFGSFSCVEHIVWIVSTIQPRKFFKSFQNLCCTKICSFLK